MFGFKPKKKPVNEKPIKSVLPFSDAMPDEPSLVKVAFLSFKEYFENRGSTTDGITVSVFDATSRIELDFMINDEFLIRTNVDNYLLLKRSSAEYIYDNVTLNLKQCESASINLKLKLLNI